MKDLLAANRYAQALFEIARMEHNDEEMGAELESFSAALKHSPEIEKFLVNPYFNVDQKRRSLQKIYQETSHKFYETLLDFFTILFEKNRFYLIHEIAVEFRKIADEAKGQGAVEIRTAVPLGAAAEAAMVTQLEKIAGYKVIVKKEVDPSLVGGGFVRIKNKILDDSIRHRIDSLKKELTKIGAI